MEGLDGQVGWWLVEDQREGREWPFQIKRPSKTWVEDSS